MSASANPLVRLRAEVLRNLHKYYVRGKQAAADGWTAGLTCELCHERNIASIARHMGLAAHQPQPDDEVVAARRCMCGDSFAFREVRDQVAFWCHLNQCRRRGGVLSELLKRLAAEANEVNAGEAESPSVVQPAAAERPSSRRKRKIEEAEDESVDAADAAPVTANSIREFLLAVDPSTVVEAPTASPPARTSAANRLAEAVLRSMSVASTAVADATPATSPSPKSAAAATGKPGSYNLVVKRSNEAFAYLLRRTALKLNVSSYICRLCDRTLPIQTLLTHARTAHDIHDDFTLSRRTDDRPPSPPPTRKTRTDDAADAAVKPVARNHRFVLHCYCPSCDRFFFYASLESVRSVFVAHLFDCVFADSLPQARDDEHEAETDGVLGDLQRKLCAIFERFELIFSPRLMQTYAQRMSLPRAQLFAGETHATLVERLVPTQAAFNAFLLADFVPLLNERAHAATQPPDEQKPDDDQPSTTPSLSATQRQQLALVDSYKRVLETLASPRSENALLLQPSAANLARDDTADRLDDQERFIDDRNVEELVNSDHTHGPQFCCTREIAALDRENRKNERDALDDELRDEFGTIDQHLDRPMPGWLVDQLRSVAGYDRELHADLFDETLCGLSMDMVALSGLIDDEKHAAAAAAAASQPALPAKLKRARLRDQRDSASSSPSPLPVFCHLFYYRTYAKKIRELLADQDSCYVLPHTCLCTDARPAATHTDRLRKLHRHVIVVFRTVKARLSFAAATNERNCPSTEHSDLRQYCKEITSRSHYFNVLRYVSREKTNDPSNQLLRLNNIRELLHTSAETSGGGDLGGGGPLRIYETFMNDQLVNTKFTSFSRLLATQTQADQFYRGTLFAETDENGGTGDSEAGTAPPQLSDLERAQQSLVPFDELELLNHSATSYHFACSKPVCSFAPSLSSILSRRGLATLFSFRRLTMPLYRALVMNAFDQVHRSAQPGAGGLAGKRTSRNRVLTSVTLAVRFSDICRPASLPLYSHSLPYARPDDPASIRLTHEVLRRIGANIPADEQRLADLRGSRPLDDTAPPLERLRLSVFADYMDEVIPLDAKIASEVYRTRRLLADIPRQVSLMFSRVENQLAVERECSRYASICQQLATEMFEANCAQEQRLSDMSTELTELRHRNQLQADEIRALRERLDELEARADL